MNQKVNLIKRVKTSRGQRFCQVVYQDGLILQDWVWFNEHQEYHPEGNYYIGWYIGRKRRWRNVGKDAETAHKQAKELESNLGPGMIRQVIREYIDEVSLVKRPSTVQRYKTVMKFFEEYIITHHIGVM